jgi:hypothetical protein
MPGHFFSLSFLSLSPGSAPSRGLAHLARRSWPLRLFPASADGTAMRWYLSAHLFSI